MPCFFLFGPISYFQHGHPPNRSICKNIGVQIVTSIMHILSENKKNSSSSLAVTFVLVTPPPANQWRSSTNLTFRLQKSASKIASVLGKTTEIHTVTYLEWKRTQVFGFQTVYMLIKAHGAIYTING